MNHRLEEARIAIRNIRRDSHNDMRDFEKEKLISEDELERGEVELQKLTDRFIEEVAEHGKKKNPKSWKYRSVSASVRGEAISCWM